MIVYDLRHYVPILARNPAPLRNGAPFKGWRLPGALGSMRTWLSGRHDGNRQFVRVLAAVQEDGLEAVEEACADAYAGKLQRCHHRHRRTVAVFPDPMSHAPSAGSSTTAPTMLTRNMNVSTVPMSA